MMPGSDQEMTLPLFQNASCGLPATTRTSAQIRDSMEVMAEAAPPPAAAWPNFETHKRPGVEAEEP